MLLDDDSAPSAAVELGLTDGAVGAGAIGFRADAHRIFDAEAGPTGWLGTDGGWTRAPNGVQLEPSIRTAGTVAWTWAYGPGRWHWAS
ncbi:hypothetical protein XA68_12233 [Ophiocordyceps unilateralis]|uniref:Uncharacterized protein n=1 Tax=Ophiocordyceps unilateralis TaxID=268505 RepID=A0A2A9PF71_OPHUN|nr:hypothetical protein XA68_12233 [Ophiocordyceps unilateralis]